jgi:hypothetical protein
MGHLKDKNSPRANLERNILSTILDRISDMDTDEYNKIMSSPIVNPYFEASKQLEKAKKLLERCEPYISDQELFDTIKGFIKT